jgi:hypothetical protein
MHSAWQGHWELVAAELLSLGSGSPSGLVPHSGNMHGLLLAMELLGCFGWLLGQEGVVPGGFGAGMDFLLVGRSDGTAAVAEETASDIAAARADTNAGAVDLA